MFKLIMKITGGRPMKYIGFAFTDIVDGSKVSYYRDYFGTIWMASSKWSLFRVKANGDV